MSGTTERITKLAVKLGNIDDRITEYNQMREEIVSEIQTILTNTVVNAAKTAMRKPKKITGSLGESITQILAQTPGQSITEIATKLKVAPQKVGLSLYHLQQKGTVFSGDDDGKFYPLAMAAKTVPATEE